MDALKCDLAMFDPKNKEQKINVNIHKQATTVKASTGTALSMGMLSKLGSAINAEKARRNTVIKTNIAAQLMG